MRNNRVVVTGGAGFIGSHLAGELAKGNQVILIDDLSSGKRENIAALVSQGNAQFLQGSVTDLGMLQEALQGADFVFHQAAIASVPRSIEDPSASHHANTTGTLNVLIAARDNKVKKVVYASSSAVYGDSPPGPKREDMPPNPQSPYAITKLAGEYYCQIFRQIYGLPTVCLRYFNVYGPRQDPGSQYAAVIPKFLERASVGKPPIIFGDGDQTRDFVFVRDAVEANILAAQSKATGVFNIGSGKSISINDLAKVIAEVVGASLKPIHREPRSGDIRHSVADIARARDFGYRPEYRLEDGLMRTVTGLLHTQG